MTNDSKADTEPTSKPTSSDAVAVTEDVSSSTPKTTTTEPTTATTAVSTASPSSFTSPSTSSVGGSGGFFTLGGSLGGSSIAERAKRLKDEEDKKKQSNDIKSIDGDDEAEDDLHLFDKLYVYNQNEEKENAYFNTLVHGFKYLRKMRDSNNDDMMGGDDPGNDKNQVNSGSENAATATIRSAFCYATVNFIDPTTKSFTAAPSFANSSGDQPPRLPQLQQPPPKPTNLLQQQSMLARAMSSTGSSSSGSLPGGTNSGSSNSLPAIENVFEKLTYIFERDYRSTLRSVQYKNIRTGEKDVISSLPVHPVLSRTGGAAPATSPTSHAAIASGSGTLASTSKAPLSPRKTMNLPWGGAASSAILPVSDPSEWHTGPFCHVYIAACENAEHYRTKVKPSLEVFVKQIESVAANTTAGRQQGAHSSEYLIVYVPVGGSTSNISSSETMTTTTTGDSSTGGSTATTKRSGSFGSRFHMARQRAFGHSTSSCTDDDDNVSRGSLDSDPELTGSGDSGDDVDSGATVALHLLSRQERSLYKKIVADFPKGKVCVLSPVSLDRSDENLESSEGVVVRTHEWNTFNRMLGSVVVSGFKERCRRYKDELKRLDAQRATAATAAKGQGKGKPSPYAFNLCHFFLVKESLAFSFEQMQLPAETLLQYDEFRLYMPDLSDNDERQVRRSRRNSKALAEDGGSEPSLMVLADTGDSIGFRRRIRHEFDLTPILDIIRRYLFAREMSLLFRMEQPVELLRRAESFVKTMYSIMLRGLSDLSEEEQNERRTNATKWVVQFIWDVKQASDFYFAAGGDHSDNASVDTMSSLQGREAVDKIVASKISDLLEISRLMFLRLGDTELDGGNPLRAIQKTYPGDLKHLWGPWTIKSEDRPINGGERAAWKPSIASSSSSTWSSKESESARRHFILSTALASPEEFEASYHDLCLGMVKTNLKAKRRRYAARLEAEIGEFYLRKGDKISAAAAFKKIVKVYKQDQWDRLHFWRLFRLAYCQRSTAEPSDYLKTLVSCFTPRLSASAPAEAMSVLQNDLEAVLAHPSVADARYGKLAFIEAVMTLPKASVDYTTIGDGVDKKQVIKRFCAVGETVQVQISITSHLPQVIHVDSVKLFVLQFGEFATILEKGDAIEEEDAAKVIPLDSPLKIQPGANQYVFEWTPSTSGQYILSTLELKWLQGYFYYDSMDLPQPLLGIDVLPSEPTHSVSLEPRFLIYGHDQEVQMTFNPGSDTIKSGKVVISCSDGLLLLPHGEDPATGEWTQKVELDLNKSNPSDKYVKKVNVRTDKSKEPQSEPESVDGPKGVSARAFTTYLNASTVSIGESATASAMRTVQESFIPVLEKAALSVDSVEHHWIEENTVVLVCFNLISNAPHIFSLAGWDLFLPVPLRFARDGDLNQHMRDEVVSNGDLISLTFECHVEKNACDGVNDGACTLSLRLAEESGDAFVLDIPVDLTSLSSSIDREQTMAGSAIVAKMKLDTTEGIVGEPVAMTYSLDVPRTGAFSTLDLVYSFDMEDSPPSWILAGKTSGLVKSTMEAQQFFCSVVGIPVVAGYIDVFPRISLAVARPEGKTMPILVDTQFPPIFLSRPPQGAVMTVGYRTAK